MYQTGYLTIKDYDPELGMFLLGIPKREVKKGIFDQLLPLYTRSASGADASIVSHALPH